MSSTPSTVLQARRTWTTLGTPDAVEGLWEASFLTPMRTVAPLGLGLIGLPRWHGKQLSADGGVNVVRTRDGDLRETLAMTMCPDISWADGGPALALGYATDAPRPWRWVRDELRALDAHTILALTFTDRPGLRSTGLPFLLRRST